MPAWLPQRDPGGPNTAPRYWASVADMVNKSNFHNTAVNTRPMPVGTPQSWQPPLTRAVSADAALKGTS